MASLLGRENECTSSNQPLVCLADYEKEAKARLPSMAKVYYFTGAGEERSLRENKDAFSRFLLRWRVLRGVGSVDLSTSLLGRRVSMPIGISPTAAHGLAHSDAEIGTARASQCCGTVMTLSTFSTSGLEEVARSQKPGAVRWFQLYMGNDRRFAENLVRSAELHGYSAIVLTIDCPASGKRLEQARSELVLPKHLRLVNFERHALVGRKVGDRVGFGEASKALSLERLSWETVAWLKSTTTLPIVIKGVMTADDARLAVEHGVQGVWVSNHGARQVDTTPASIEALPEVLAAVGGRCEVYVDGGVRCGTDVLKALALGANAVFVGRPVLWGLACGGQAGVQNVLEILRNELSLAMMLMGCRSTSDLAPSLVVHQNRYRAHL